MRAAYFSLEQPSMSSTTLRDLWLAAPTQCLIVVFYNVFVVCHEGFPKGFRKGFRGVSRGFQGFPHSDSVVGTP